jgi:hypothetical protein
VALEEEVAVDLVVVVVAVLRVAALVAVVVVEVCDRPTITGMLEDASMLCFLISVWLQCLRTLLPRKSLSYNAARHPP